MQVGRFVYGNIIRAGDGHVDYFALSVADPRRDRLANPAKGTRKSA